MNMYKMNCMLKMWKNYSKNWFFEKPLLSPDNGWEKQKPYFPNQLPASTNEQILPTADLYKLFKSLYSIVIGIRQL